MSSVLLNRVTNNPIGNVVRMELSRLNNRINELEKIIEECTQSKYEKFAVAKLNFKN